MSDLRKLATEAIEKARTASPFRPDVVRTEAEFAQVKANGEAFLFFAKHGEVLAQALLDRLSDS